MTEILDVAELGDRIRSLRLSRGFSLQDLSGQASVSVSMLSAVERGDKVASIQILHQIAQALKTSIDRLIEDEAPPRVILLRRVEQAVVNDGSGWVRRLLSPALPGLEFEMTRTRLEPGVEAGESGLWGRGFRAYLAVEDGALTVILDGRIFHLETGDSASFAGDSRSVFRNDSNATCIYYFCLSSVL
ncbi:helix-turn-helix domain-containing protein [Denitrobaculum tricleocarpae]|uniref:Helix-turn-helix domain-containing protein n=1 Tax=Denitrobaculum tricleocarpae TaxID=2591009 RepID=A0A545U1F8_9PROT|nr:helix-turn-helix domain-containing protein [Denitrobaculum tricleocarpae]TQV83274.1 helix-turn-helix domain-containing protein [Denitrobaculum tricleocarpae]